MILHFSHIGFTDGRTFIRPFSQNVRKRAQAYGDPRKRDQ